MSRLTGSILAALSVLMTACAGFTPLYAEPGVTAGLQQIEVRAPDTRTGFVLRGHLEDALGYRREDASTYRLTTQVRERRTPLGSRADDTATRYELTLTVAYALTEIRGNRRLHEDLVTVSTTYAAAAQPYAGVVAAEDGSDRAAAQAASLIREDLARWFAEPAGSRPE
ncbi:LPS assembly lipoprotein LptE [Brevundimonas aveniformis]|uniref:LPS assembly lipoprotein LptE n=1 Tax=Brevundimonas aveniformis TaxID=370977 RepID=UPI00040F0827|nr:LPS assembly lipoprotein LptE [Brevundimonas aveniformis]